MLLSTIALVATQAVPREARSTVGIALAIVALLVSLYLLERGADHFTDSVRTLARRLRAPESVVGLLTAGGEWEELVVVAFALVSGHPGIAAGTIIGSCIVNLAGSTPLGLLGRQPLIRNPAV